MFSSPGPVSAHQVETRIEYLSGLLSKVERSRVASDELDRNELQSNDCVAGAAVSPFKDLEDYSAPSKNFLPINLEFLIPGWSPIDPTKRTERVHDFSRSRPPPSTPQSPPRTPRSPRKKSPRVQAAKYPMKKSPRNMLSRIDNPTPTNKTEENPWANMSSGADKFFSGQCRQQ